MTILMVSSIRRKLLLAKKRTRQTHASEMLVLARIIVACPSRELPSAERLFGINLMTVGQGTKSSFNF